MKEIAPVIATAKPSPPRRRQPNWQPGFLAMMPNIIKHANQAFRYLDAEARAEAIQDVVVSAMLAYVRLYDRGKVGVAYPSALARFAVAQYVDGRRVGVRLNCRDVLSPYARRKKGIRVESLHDYDRVEHSWRDLLVEDKHAGPAETAAARIDFAEWIASLTGRNRMIAEALAEGSTTKDVARWFRLSPGRISQMRREFLESWQRFQGEDESPSEDELAE